MLEAVYSLSHPLTLSLCQSLSRALSLSLPPSLSLSLSLSLSRSLSRALSLSLRANDDAAVSLAWGADTVSENILGLNFSISPSAFFQVLKKLKKSLADIYLVQRMCSLWCTECVLFFLYVCWCGAGISMKT